MTLAESARLLADVEAFCTAIRDIEELCYVEHRFNDQVIPLAKKHNILGMPVPAEYGGRGSDTATYARALARIGQYPIMTWGNDEQKKRYLPASVKAEKILAFGLTEPDAGSNPLEMTMQYERQGDQYVLNGVKYLISNAGIATTAVCFAYPKGRKGRISAFIVDLDGPGCSREDLVAKVGMPTANTGMFELSNYKVPVANMLGEEGNGFKIAMGTLVSGRISVAAGCLGVIEDCLTEAVHYAKERHQHGKAIGK